MLPNMSDVLTVWESPATIKTVTKATVNFVETNTVAGRTQNCVIQVADKEKLNLDTINWSLEYITVHSKLNIEIGELIEYKARDFIVISRAPWDDYGYSEVIAEETKSPLVAVTA